MAADSGRRGPLFIVFDAVRRDEPLIHCFRRAWKVFDPWLFWPGGPRPIEGPWGPMSRPKGNNRPMVAAKEESRRRMPEKPPPPPPPRRSQTGRDDLFLPGTGHGGCSHPAAVLFD